MRLNYSIRQTWGVHRFISQSRQNFWTNMWQVWHPRSSVQVLFVAILTSWGDQQYSSDCRGQGFLWYTPIYIEIYVPFDLYYYHRSHPNSIFTLLHFILQAELVFNSFPKGFRFLHLNLLFTPEQDPRPAGTLHHLPTSFRISGNDKGW